MNNKLNDIKIYLVDIDRTISRFLSLAFSDIKNVEVVTQELSEFMQCHQDIDCIVSPANAYGEMTGGFDAAISNYLGWEFQGKVQKYINDHYFGEQPIGTSFIIDTNKEGLKLIHTPTMRIPEKIIDDRIVYQCMRTTLMCAIENNIKSIVIPAFGGACGNVAAPIIARHMKKAYEQILYSN